MTAAAVLGAAAGAWIVVWHLSSDAFIDTSAYYGAAQRLNAGLPLYPPGVDTAAAEFYSYPPLLAIAFRPLALVPYPIAVGIWETVLLLGFAATIQRLGLTTRTLVAAAILAFPIGWALSISQAQILVTLLMTIGSPLSIALAAHLKVLPGLVALYWVGRREWRELGRFGAWLVGLGALQFVLEPRGTADFFGFLSLSNVGRVTNLSPYAVSPLLWAALFVLGAVATVRLARTRYGWAAAVAFSILASPRLLAYMLSSLLAVLKTDMGPERRLHQR